jgi:hypothetical protein
MRHWIWAGALSSALLACGAEAADPAYSDAFEGPALNAFWTPSTSRGSFSFTAAAAHGGAKGVQFDTTADATGQKTVQLAHTFTQPVYGKLSVWLFDTAAGEASSNYFRFFASPTPVPGNGWGAQLLTHDGSPDPHYTAMAFNTGEVDGGVARSKAWHLWEIDDRTTGLTLSVDGQVVLTSATAQPFSTVTLMMTAPGFRPGWTGYYDDFQFTPVPEPTTAGVVAGASGLLAATRRGRRGR